MDGSHLSGVILYRDQGTHAVDELMARRAARAIRKLDSELKLGNGDRRDGHVVLVVKHRAET